jgi:hypothetical protein
MRDWAARLLRSRTGRDVGAWNRRVAEAGLPDEQALRAWLDGQGVTGYGQALLVWERFGYPDFLTAEADELIAGQYSDRPQLRPVFDAVLAALPAAGPATVQARKTPATSSNPQTAPWCRNSPWTSTSTSSGQRPTTEYLTSHGFTEPLSGPLARKVDSPAVMTEICAREVSEMPLLPPLISPEELRGALDDERVRVFDTTVFLRRAVDGGPYTVESGRESYARAHIPGAGFADIPGALSDPVSPFAFTLPAAEHFADAIGRLGVGDGTHVVAYAQDVPMWATRLWWLLRYFGYGSLTEWSAHPDLPLITG